MRALRFAVLGAALIAPLLAQQPPAQTPPVFRGGTDAVEVDVVVHDRTGRFVTDLKPEEFEVRDEGKPQPIDLFYLVQGGTSTSLAVRAEGARPQGAAGGASPTAAAPPRFFVVVFDDDHLSPGGFKRVQAAALELFSKQFKAGDAGGVVVAGQMANGRLSTDREELLKDIRTAKPNSKSKSKQFDEREWPQVSEAEAVRIVANDSVVLTAAISRACADDAVMCRVADASVKSKAKQLSDEARSGSNQTLQSLKALLNGLARLDGRKTVLLLSEGFIADEAWPVVQESVALAARANARIYTLDARGLDRGMSERLLGPDPGVSDAVARLVQQLDYGSDPVNSLAADTGGFVVRNTNIFDKAVAQIVDDASNYYVLGYRPAAAPDGRFHKLTVKVRRSGVTFRARRGYVATPRPAATTTETTVKATETNPTIVDAPAAAAAPAEVSPSPPPTPDPTKSDPALSEATIVPAAPGGSATPGVRARPDASKHVDLLEKDAPSDRGAAAGWDAYQRGDLATARASLASAAGAPGARPWVHYALGQSEYALRQFADAAAEWEKVRASAPEFEPVYFDLVDAYLQIKEYDRAIRLLREGVRRWPNDTEVYNALGVVQVSRGAYDDAVGSFQRAVSAAPAEGVGYFNLAKALELRYQKSRRYVQQTRMVMFNTADRDNAITNYKRYLQIGGPFENAAREGLARLEWQSTPP